MVTYLDETVMQGYWKDPSGVIRWAIHAEKADFNDIVVYLKMGSFANPLKRHTLITTNASVRLVGFGKGVVMRGAAPYSNGVSGCTPVVFNYTTLAASDAAAFNNINTALYMDENMSPNYILFRIYMDSYAATDDVFLDVWGYAIPPTGEEYLEAPIPAPVEVVKVKWPWEGKRYAGGTY